jgi:LmbE family N-acetylglucosaminyl deacetylase
LSTVNLFDLDKLQEQDLLPYACVAQLPRGKVMVLAPHADDEVFGCGGAIMQHLAQGDSVQVCIVTDGAAAQGLDTSAGADYVAQRRHESLAAAAVLAYGQPLFWELSDRQLNAQYDLLYARLIQELSDSKAEVLYIPSLHEIHPDHYALAVAAVRAALNPELGLLYLCQYEIGVPCRPNTLLDITAVAARKRAAIRCFSSQLALQNYSAHIFALNRYRTYTLAPTVEFAEAFYILECAALRHDPLSAYGNSRHTRHCQTLLAACQAQLNAVYASTSWRLSAPLRALKKWWR